MEILNRQLIGLFTLILLMGFIVSPCCASLLSVDSNTSVSLQELDGGLPSKTPAEVKDQYFGFTGMATVNLSALECCSLGCVADEVLTKTPNLSCTDILYVRDSLWFPRPPIDDLLKIPIAKKAVCFLFLEIN